MSQAVATASVDGIEKIAAYAGPVALAAFAGVFLGGLALSMFWKWFGPWKALEDARKSCLECEARREADMTKIIRLEAELAENKAGLQMLREAMRGGGFALALVAPDRRD
jgi:hypothetical protein